MEWETKLAIIGMILVAVLAVIGFVALNNDITELGSSICATEYNMQFKIYTVGGILKCYNTLESYDGITVELIGGTK